MSKYRLVRNELNNYWIDKYFPELDTWMLIQEVKSYKDGVDEITYLVNRDDYLIDKENKEKITTVLFEVKSNE